MGFEILQKCKAPITLYFKEFNDLYTQWSKATDLKEEANNLYKEKKTEAAIEKVSAAIELHPTNKILYSNRILMYLNSENYELALADCQIIRQLDPKSMYIKGHYLRGLTLLKMEKYKNAAAAFQTVVKLNPSFKKATDRLNECFKELEKENAVIEKRRSSQQQILKEQFQTALSGQNEDEKKEETKVKVEEKSEENKVVDHEKTDSIEDDGVKVELIEEDKEKDKNEENVSIFEQKDDVNDEKPENVENGSLEQEQDKDKLDASAPEFTMAEKQEADPVNP